MAGDLRDLAINDGGELVDQDRLSLRLHDQASERNPELLTIGEQVVRPEPRRDGVEPDRIARVRDLIHVEFRVEVVDHPGAVPGQGPRLAELAQDRRLAGSGRADDRSDTPRSLTDVGFDLPTPLLVRSLGDVEHGAELTGSS